MTGRPRKDCAKFLSTHDLTAYFPVCICMEDGPPKPSPIPVQLACERLNLPPRSCLMIGDTPDDIKAGVAAGSYSVSKHSSHFMFKNCNICVHSSVC